MIERSRLTDGYEISRLIKGGWHLAGGHGQIDENQAIADMASFVEAGITTFDCADIYTGVEELIGRFRARYPSLAAITQVHTKLVPDLSLLANVTSEYIHRIIDRSLMRLGAEQLDLVQFHWWDFGTPGYVEAMLELDRLRRMGKIARLGVTNFDTAHLREITTAGVKVTAHQLQYSLLDHRPESLMLEYCASEDIAVLCYGTVAGGFLSDRWIGEAAPKEPLSNRSLVKYRLIIDEFGDWEAFQSLLRVLHRIGRNHQVDVATVATRAILQKAGVSAAIVGATNNQHLDMHTRLSNVVLSGEELAEIATATAGRKGPNGDVYALERNMTGPHGRIMKYNLGDTAVAG